MSSLSATRVLFFERHPFQEVVCFTCAEPVNQLFDDTVVADFRKQSTSEIYSIQPAIIGSNKHINLLQNQNGCNMLSYVHDQFFMPIIMGLKT